MKRKYKAIFVKLTGAAISTMLLCGIANASTIHIKNDDTTEVDITIEGGDGNILNPGKEAIGFILKEGEEKIVEVKKTQLHKETFSVTGKVPLPSLYNKCGPLLIDKNYKIIFTGSKVGGTICISAPIN